MDRLGWMAVVLGTVSFVAGAWGLLRLRSPARRAAESTADIERPQVWWLIVFGLHWVDMAVMRRTRAGSGKA